MWPHPVVLQPVLEGALQGFSLPSFRFFTAGLRLVERLASCLCGLFAVVPVGPFRFTRGESPGFLPGLGLSRLLLEIGCNAHRCPPFV